MIIDEVPQLDTIFPHELPIYSHLLLEHLTLVPSNYQGLYAVLPADEDRIRRLLQQPHDQVLDVFQPVLRKLMSRNHLVFVDQDTYDKLNGQSVHKPGQDQKNRIYFLSVLSPQAFEDATILGANVEASLLYQWCVQCGYRFEEHAEISAQLRDAPFTGDRLDIRYFIPGRPFSKYLRDRPINGISLIEQMDKLALEELDGKPFLYATNNDRAQQRPGWTNATPLSVASHGLNTYADHHAIYFSAAVNREPKHYKLLEALGLSAEMIDKSTSHEIIYQAVMRTSLRNPESTEKVLAIVPDEPSARTLADLTGCERVSQLGNLVPSRPARFTSSQKNNRARAKKLLDELYGPNSVPYSLLNDSGTKTGKLPEGAHFCDVIVTFHKKPYATSSSEHTVQVIETQAWIGYLRQLSNTVVERKDEGLLFTPAVFDPPNGAEGYRRREHFLLSSFMVLDFDGGSVSPEAFEEIFWSKAKKGNKISFIICNSFSRSQEQPNKFRAILFYRRPALSLEQHEAVFDWLEQRLSEAGYPKETSGLDRTCRSGVQPFWLPCTNRAHPESRFFWQRGTKTRELERCSIVPEKNCEQNLGNELGRDAPRRQLRGNRSCDTSATLHE